MTPTELTAERVGAPTVSVVIPTRNRPQPLRSAITSVLEQRYPGHLEVIVVHDRCPPDRSLELASQGKSGRSIQVLANERTPGPAGARNTGCVAASGALLGFCDDDDVWHPDKLRWQVPRLGGDADAVAVMSGIVARHGDRAVVRLPPADPLQRAQLLRSRVASAHQSTLVVRRDVFLEIVGPFDESFPESYGEDYDWLLRAAAVGKVAVVRRPLVTVTWRSGSYFAERWQTMIAAIDQLLAKHPDLTTDPRGHARLLGRKAFAYSALGRGSLARRYAFESIRSSWRERRAYLALLVAAGAVRAERAGLVEHLGRGV